MREALKRRFLLLLAIKKKKNKEKKKPRQIRWNQRFNAAILFLENFLNYSFKNSTGNKKEKKKKKKKNRFISTFGLKFPCDPNGVSVLVWFLVTSAGSLTLWALSLRNSIPSIFEGTHTNKKHWTGHTTFPGRVLATRPSAGGSTEMLTPSVNTRKSPEKKKSRWLDTISPQSFFFVPKI